MNLVWGFYGIGAIFLVNGLSLFPGGDPVLASIITALLFVPLGIVYAMLLMATPRAGGDYVYVSRTLHPALGYVLNFTLIVWFLFGTGSILNQLFTLALWPSFYGNWIDSERTDNF